MSDIDNIFDELEKKVGSGGMSWSHTLINGGMVAVILASIFIWIKLNTYETKNT